MAYILAKDSLISDIAKNSPRAIELLTEYGLSCANCFLNQFDTIESGSRLHGMSDGEIAAMITDINTLIAKESK